MRWLLVFLLAFVLFNGLSAGDFSFRWRGREFHVPLASSIVLSVLAMLIGLWF
jgi:hypothetical protein